MATRPAPQAVIDPEQLFEGFENLMPFRVQDILLVSSLYDSFILREDGRLNELLIGESVELDLKNVPGITHVSSGSEALDIVRRQPRYNLIVANLHVGDMDAAELARRVKDAGLDVPVVVLAYDYRAIKEFVARNPVTDIERIFLWQGNVRILIAIVKYIEDKRNVVHDTDAIGVPVMLVVEDNIRYYSSFLPVIYTELITQSRRLISEGLNVAHKLVRMRARPKILLCSTYEEAVDLVIGYRDFLFGVVSDVEFPRDGTLTPDAGFDLANMVHKVVPDVPIVLQSSRTAFMDRARAEGFVFLRKRSPTLLADLRRFLIEHVGFGDFVFRLSDGTEVARAQDMAALERLLHEVPAESIAFHSERNHFSHWLMARTEFAVAQRLRPRKNSDFATVEHLRRDLIDSIADYRREQSEVVIGDFNAGSFNGGDNFFLRIGGGSLGGKARGLAFVRHLLRKHRMTRRFPGVSIAVPPSLVIASDLFDQFLDENDLLDLAMHGKNDDQIIDRFVTAQLPRELQDSLRAFLDQVHYPVAVRSSSLLEDSQYQPFTGVYETFMLTNRGDLDARLEQLMEAIKRVYASTFSQHAKSYVRATPYRLEEEKMAVIIQQVVGGTHGQRFYPDFSGVVRSYNFYPAPPMNFRDGIAAVALGLGRAVVEGGRCLTFCPRYPRHLMQFSSVEDILANTQAEFWALNFEHANNPADGAPHLPPLADVGERGGVEGAPHLPDVGRCGNGLRETAFPLRAAEQDGTLYRVASTYSPDNHAVYDGISRPGPRVVTFAPILKHNIFPLADILDELTHIGEDALSRPVEIEFAVTMPPNGASATNNADVKNTAGAAPFPAGEGANQTPANSTTAQFGFLQMRPLVLSRESEELRMDDVDPARLICQSNKVLGNGRIANLRDLIVVDFHRFERSRSRDVATAVAQFNARLTDSNTPYLLIGVGRWGSNDPWLGIPVEWDEISGARAIVEAGFRDFRVTPSQGSHFFQNLTAFQIGYFTINPDSGEGFVDWQWLTTQPAVEELDCVRHLRFSAPLTVMMNGKTGQGMVFKPEGCIF